MIDYFRHKVDAIILKKLDLSIVKRRMQLFIAAAMLLIAIPYINLKLFGILSTMFVIYSTYIGLCKCGPLASFWSLIVLSIFLKLNMIDVDRLVLFSFILMLLIISVGFGKLIKYYINLINDLGQTKEELKETNQQLNREFKKVKRVHKSFLPQNVPKIKNFYFNSFYQAAEIVSGDYYNYIELKDKVIGYVSDVTGHGLDGALINVFIREKVNNFFNQNKTVSSKNILGFLSEKFSEENFPADYSLCITLWVLDKKSGVLYYNNAGNHIPIFLIENKNIKEKFEENPPISNVFSLSDYNFANNKIKLECGNKVLFLTDGLIEQEINNKMYGIERLKKVVKKSKADNNLLDFIYSDFKNLLGDNSQEDDITMFCIQKRCDRILN
ncbi:SpoIIE family protein phosphatase [Halanaerobacter jeridensis]|uniref:Serine phosphatase RsbU (Regulator of sigma subunit) n=1 Tax=Halanaerobacter jeridensis TaxID=706427 RepID=A0A938XNZ3_9FIRM|nr:serine phosphatase RsbU (regulator of sigma subunit) [Halanaerobacter jeridensis]